MNLPKRKPKVYKGPIIEIRGMLRLVAAALPFLVLALAFRDNGLWVVSFLSAAFTSASFVGIEKTGRRFRYALVTTFFVVAAVLSAWQASDRMILLIAWLMVWSVAACLSFAGGPTLAYPVNVGLMLFMLLLLGDRLDGASFEHLILYAAAGVGWSFFLGTIRLFGSVKNELDLPNVNDIRTLAKQEFSKDSTYLQIGIVRGLLVICVATLAYLTDNLSLVITIFTITVAMLPGRSQTTLKVLSRVASAVGAIVAANLLLGIRPPVWVYLTVFVLGSVIIYAGVRWILLRSYTYNSFFMSTFPLFILGLGGYSETSWNKVWYTLLGGILAIAACELIVFRINRAKEQSA